MSRLAWRCRRGTKELDVLLQRYLNRRYFQATPTEQRTFENLLELQDPQLQDYLSGHTEPAEPEVQRLIRSILSLPP